MIDGNKKRNKAKDLYILMVAIGNKEVFFGLNTIFDKVITDNSAKKKKYGQIAIQGNV